MRPYQDDDVGDRAHIRHAEAIIFQPEREYSVQSRAQLFIIIIGKSCTIHWGREVQITFRESGTSSIGTYIKVEEI